MSLGCGRGRGRGNGRACRLGPVARGHDRGCVEVSGDRGTTARTGHSVGLVSKEAWLRSLATRQHSNTCPVDCARFTGILQSH